MREMREKFGAEVKAFPYAFVIKNHHPGWDNLSPEQMITLDAGSNLPAFPSLPLYAATLGLPSATSSAKSSKNIEVKRRP